ncbi:TPA: glycosyltransferase family 32 protein [Acinetobacter baumannii]|nr:hypothetical protein [Acinetobacter baumannii]EHU2752123.1 hypothetical protein [Acinetobacter baumannii]
MLRMDKKIIVHMIKGYVKSSALFFRLYKKMLMCSFYIKKNKNEKEILFNYRKEDEKDLIVRNGENGKEKKIPKIIWMYWHSKNVPSYILAMINKIKVLNKSHEVFLLHQDTLGSYLPDFIVSEDLPFAIQADLIRLALLKEYGGIYIDVSTIVYESFDWVHNKAEYDLIAYYRYKETLDNPIPLIENWFLCAPKGSKLIQEWLDILEPINKLGIYKFYLRNKSRVDYSLLIENINNPIYFAAYISERIALKNLAYKVNLFLKRSDVNAWLYQDNVNWKVLSLADTFMNKNKPKKLPPLIKLSSNDRLLIDEFMQRKIVNKNSILGEFLE